MNYKELPDVIDWAHGLGARVLNVFFMVCTGRGEELTDISPEQYEEVLAFLVESQDRYSDMLVRARCARTSSVSPMKRIPIPRSPRPKGTWAGAAWPGRTTRGSRPTGT